MKRISCILILTFLFLTPQSFGSPAGSDSSGKDEIIVRGKASRKQSIVYRAIEEYQRWRKDSVLRETDSAAITTLKQYWRFTGLAPKEEQLKDSLWQDSHPWSAVFISWVMKQAGVGDQFSYSINHAKYIVRARENARPGKGKKFFSAYDICDSRSTWPEPGDLICMNRDGNNFSLVSLQPTDISHCDIVVGTDRAARTITTIGGNLRNTVSKRIIYLDEWGFIDRGRNWKLLDAENQDPEGNQTDFFAIIKIHENKNLRDQLTRN
jgi:hypothetical protein